MLNISGDNGILVLFLIAEEKHFSPFTFHYGQQLKFEHISEPYNFTPSTNILCF